MLLCQSGVRFTISIFAYNFENQSVQLQYKFHRRSCWEGGEAKGGHDALSIEDILLGCYFNIRLLCKIENLFKTIFW